MIARIWSGRALPTNAETYARHFTGTVLPILAATPGHEGACLLRRAAAGKIEFLAVTLWKSIASVEAFAGGDVDRAVIEPAARVALTDFDEAVKHFEVVHLSLSEAPEPRG